MAWETYTHINSESFLYNIALGKIPGYVTEFVVGDNPDVGMSTQELVWDQGGFRVTPPEGSSIFASSSNAADTGLTMVITGLDENFDRFISIVVLNGQTTVQFTSGIPNGINWIQGAIIVAGNAPIGAIGDVFVYLTSTTTGGIPDDVTAIQMKIIAGNNFGRLASFMVPTGQIAITVALRGGTDSVSKPARISTKITVRDAPTITTIEYTVLPDFPGFAPPLPVASAPAALGGSFALLPEKTILEYHVIATSNNTRVYFSYDLLIVPATEFGGG